MTKASSLKLRATDARVLAATVAVSIADGFDVNAISFAAPFVAPQMQLSPEQMGSVFSIGLVGAVIGALLAGPLSARFGRRAALIGCLLWFAAGSFGTIFVDSYNELLIARFITGIGLGVPIPLLLAIIGDSIPHYAKARALSFSFAGLPIGGSLVSLVTNFLVPHFGWPAIFIVGGIFPLLILPIVLLWKDEPAADPQPARQQTVSAADVGGPGRRGSYVDLLKDGRLRDTVTVMSAILLSSILTYFLLNWIPSLLASRTATGHGVVGGGLLNLGMILSTIICGYLIDKFGVFRVTGLSFLIAAPLVFSLGVLTDTMRYLYPVVFLTGFFAIGAQLGTTFMLVTRFDAQVRIYASSVGYIAARTGAILAPLTAGILLSRGLDTFYIFCIAAVVALAGTLALVVIGATERRRHHALSAA